MRMLISALALGLVVATAAPARAQGGVIVGVNFANIEVNDNEAPESDRRTGFAAGIFLRLPVAPSVTIQPEVLFSQKGAKFNNGFDDPAEGEVTLELDYLDVPVLARITAGGDSGLVIFGGPSFGFKLRARSRFEVGDQKEEEDLGDDVEDFDLGVVVGAGFQGRSVFLDGRYQWGLTNINKDVTDDVEVKNRVISIMLGFRF